MGHTTTPWYVTWCELYDELHIQSAPDDSDNHVLTMSYRHSSSCPAHPDYKSNAQCDPSECEGLREAMCNAKLIVESVNEKTFGGQLLINQTLWDEVGV
jgi:hypothetical protein